MISLSPINTSASDVFLECVGRVRDKKLRGRLTSIVNHIAQHEKDFDSAGTSGAFFTLPSHDMVGDSVTKAEMVDVYTQQMVDPRSRGRVYYDRIMAIATNGRCPLCGHRDVSTLDHYMPKTSHPGLVVCPKNLLPACSDCNKVKTDDVPTCASKQTLNPYYDNVDNSIWLIAKFRKTLPVIVEYSVAEGGSAVAMRPMTARRLRYHFKTLRLARLYSMQATGELGNIKQFLTNLLNSSSWEDVRDHLSEQAASRAAAARNSWQTALYRALAESKWFCSVGCRG
jgi:hypothetical protein